MNHAIEARRTLPDLCLLPLEAALRPQGSATVIILERDHSLHNYPPTEPSTHVQQAALELPEAQVQPHLLRRIIKFIFDLLGINTMEVRIHDHMQH
ncbi:hypothetical protein CJ255_08135 [Candidatus Viridilinea mediisalina]|uniref:Uncharacterized protein n=2 Tax=Candidatus Viridilinea mediisalina TaxID=2024553 RepID=A0A2A6RKV6_9CHLR|nr:hypothetical protein CJ255_08135 [Candidatus Viridilinea mediisalina]